MLGCLLYTACSPVDDVDVLTTVGHVTLRNVYTKPHICMRAGVKYIFKFTSANGVYGAWLHVPESPLACFVFLHFEFCTKIYYMLLHYL